MARVPRHSGTGWLTLGGWLSIAAGAAHLACIAGGGDWYRAFGAGEGMARAAERGDAMPALLTVAIAAILVGWGAIALSAAGRIVRLPLLRVALSGITAIYLLRGAMLFAPSAFNRPDLSTTFIVTSSLIVLAYGIVHAVGLRRGWAMLSKKEAA